MVVDDAGVGQQKVVMATMNRVDVSSLRASLRIENTPEFELLNGTGEYWGREGECQGELVGGFCCEYFSL